MFTNPTVRAVMRTIAAALFALVPGGAPVPAAEQETESVAAGELLLFTAISLKEALDDLIVACADRNPAIAVRVHAGASGLLARQIENGAPADLFLSAAPLDIDRLQQAGLLRPGGRVAFAGNRLVIAVARGIEPPATFRDLADPRFDRIAVGNPRTVPAGRYADEALRSLGLYEALAARLVPAENARQVLDYVERGETAAGIIYRTDARLAGENIVIGPQVPPEAHAPIVYEAAVPRGAAAPDAALLFLDFLASGEGQAILSRFGFLPAPAR